MIIACPCGKKKFEVEASLIPNEGKLLQCGTCSKKWFFKKEINEEINQQVKTTEIIDKNVPDNTEKLITEAEKAINKTEKNSTKNKINILNFLLVLIITFVALVILLDTFKNSINLLIPGFDLILNNLYETLKDIILFIKDIFN